MAIINYSQYVAIATKDLPSQIDYTKYLGAPNKSNMYSSRDAQNAHSICKHVARVLLVP